MRTILQWRWTWICSTLFFFHTVYCILLSTCRFKMSWHSHTGRLISLSEFCTLRFSLLRGGVAELYVVTFSRTLATLQEFIRHHDVYLQPSRYIHCRSFSKSRCLSGWLLLLRGKFSVSLFPGTRLSFPIPVIWLHFLSPVSASTLVHIHSFLLNQSQFLRCTKRSLRV